VWRYDGGDCLECSAGCPQLWRGDGICDPACNVPECNFDDNDCVECAPGCFQAWVGDTICDEPCQVAACQYDLNDCATDATGMLLIKQNTRKY
jgi:hypothetical protein